MIDAAIADRVPRGTLDRLRRYVALLTAASREQNLIAVSTVPHIWQRHILDSLQLSDLAPTRPGRWIDVGSGGGLPGMVIAIAGDGAFLLIEPRRRRAEFLCEVIADLELGDRVAVAMKKSEAVRAEMPATVISARAVASLDQVFARAIHLSDRSTTWLLPKGRSAAQEVAIARRSWQGEFQLVPSITEPDAAIVVASNVRRRGKQ